MHSSRGHDRYGGGSVPKLGVERVSGASPHQMRFRVAFCTGSDPEFPVDELNTHSPQTRGWQSQPFCQYPQEIGLQFLSGAVMINQLQILSHESKIASKIDVFVGTGERYESAVFKKLGHISLDVNERSDFAARELKSVLIGKPGTFLKLSIHKCHVNRHNIYNQVGIIAVNVLGVPMDPGAMPPQSARGANAGGFSAPVRGREQNISPMEDLAFGMNFDSATAAKIKEIHIAKERAVENEEYELAKQLKFAEEHAKHIGTKLAQLESMKREAVQQEDYDQAAMIKREIQVLRDEIGRDVDHLLQQGRGGGGGVAYRAPMQAKREQYEPTNAFNNQFRNEAPREVASREPSPAYRDPYGNEPHSGSFSPAGYGAQGGYQDEAFLNNQTRADDERPLPSLQNKGQQPPEMEEFAKPTTSRLSPRADGNPDDDENQEDVDPEIIREALDGVPGYEELPVAESMPPALLLDAQPLVRVFGEYLVRCLYSRQIRLRTAGLTKIEMNLQRYDFTDLAVFSAFCTVTKLFASDKVANMFMQASKVFDSVIEMTDDGKALKRQDILPQIEGLMAGLVERLGNTTTRIRDGAIATLMRMAQWKQVGPGFVCSHVIRLLRPGKSMLWRPLLGRLKVVLELVQQYGVGEDRGLGIESIMQFILVNDGLTNPHAEVRECTKEVVMQLYTHAGDAVFPYLKDLRPKQMEEYEAGFQQIDMHNGKPAPARASGGGVGGSGGNSPNPSLRSPAGRSKPARSPTMAKASPKPSLHGDESGSDAEEPFTCHFCGRHDPEFTEDVLDMHYWRECPMLSSCPQCEQVIEVSMMNDHLLTECENKDNHKACPRCAEAVHVHHYDQHVKRGNCLPAKPPQQANRCPLCHKDIKPGVQGWKAHLLRVNGCPKNTRTKH